MNRQRGAEQAGEGVTKSLGGKRSKRLVQGPGRAPTEKVPLEEPATGSEGTGRAVGPYQQSTRGAPG